MKTQTREKNYVKWHPYPAEMPPHTDYKVTYLVTKEMPKTKFLESRRFQTTAKGDGNDFEHYSFVSAARVIAWAFMPEDYEG